MTGRALTKFSNRNCEDMGINSECRTFSLSGDFKITHSLERHENFIGFSILKNTELQVFREGNSVRIRFLGKQDIESTEEGVQKISGGRNSIQAGEDYSIEDDFVSMPSGLFFVLLKDAGVTLMQSSLAKVGDGVAQDVVGTLTL